MKALTGTTTAILVAVLLGTVGCNPLLKPRYDNGVRDEVDRIIDTIKVEHQASLGNDGCTSDNIVYRRE